MDETGAWQSTDLLTKKVKLRGIVVKNYGGDPIIILRNFMGFHKDILEVRRIECPDPGEFDPAFFCS